MRKILYISNIEVPYRVKFFNQLAESCDLTVLYERRRSSNRDQNWANGEEIKYKVQFLDGINIGNEYSFSIKILKWIFGDYDEIIIGCYNSKVEIFSIFVMRFFGKPYILSNDGEIFKKNGIKSKIKKYILRGAKTYITAGDKSAESLRRLFPQKPVYSYCFSSLTEEEIKHNACVNCIRENYVLVVGQYYAYKGMDIALETARKDRSIQYKFVGMGARTDLFIQNYSAQEESNIIFIPFLQKKELEEEYKKCKLLLLPTRGECWGLVVNEAASFGTPIVSTWGSGAAVEFLGDKYPEFLAEPDNAESLYNTVFRALTHDTHEYSEYLLNQSKSYSIEEMVRRHNSILNQPF